MSPTITFGTSSIRGSMIVLMLLSMSAIDARADELAPDHLAVDSTAAYTCRQVFGPDGTRLLIEGCDIGKAGNRTGMRGSDSEVPQVVADRGSATPSP